MITVTKQDIANADNCLNEAIQELVRAHEVFGINSTQFKEQCRIVGSIEGWLYAARSRGEVRLALEDVK